MGWCVRVHPLFHRWFQNVFNQGVARVDDAGVGMQHLQQKGLKGRSVKKIQRILLWWPQKQNNRKKEKMSQHSKKKKISNNNKMYRTKPFGISCTLHSVQRRSTNRDTALSHTTTWFVFTHVSHSSEEAWGKDKQNVFVLCVGSVAVAVAKIDRWYLECNNCIDPSHQCRQRSFRPSKQSCRFVPSVHIVWCQQCQKRHTHRLNE